MVIPVILLVLFIRGAVTDEYRQKIWYEGGMVNASSYSRSVALVDKTIEKMWGANLDDINDVNSVHGQ